MVTTTKVKCLSIEETSVTAEVFSTAQTSRSEPTMSTTESGSRICGKVMATVTTITKICTLASGRVTDATGWARSLHASKIDTRVSGKMTCATEREL